MAQAEDVATQQAAQWTTDAARALDAVCRAARHYSLYPPGHPGSGGAVSSAVEAIAALTTEQPLRPEQPGVVVAAVGERLFVNGSEAAPDAVTARVAKELRERNIRAMKLLPGLDAPEAEALLQLLATDPRQLQQRGGPAAIARERALAHVEIEEISYERFVPQSVAARDAGSDELLRQVFGGAGGASDDLDITGLVGLLETPEQLATKLVSWLGAHSERSGYGGERGSGVGPGVGDGIGSGGEIPLIIAGHEVDKGNRAGAMLALALQRLGEAVREHSPDEWAAMRQKLTEVFRSLSVGLRRRVLQADVVSPEAQFDVLASVGENLEFNEALELLGTDAEEAIEDPSVVIERLLRRLAPTQDRLQRMAPAVQERLKELGLPDEASASVVGRLLDALRSRKPAGSNGGQLGSFRTDEATRERRRTEGRDLFVLLDEEAMWRARVSVCLEVLETARDAEAYLCVLDAIESSLGRVGAGDGDGIAVRVVNVLRQRQQSEDLPQHCRRRTARALAKLERTGGVESVRSAIEDADGAERSQLIALLADLGPPGRTALLEMLKEKSHVADLPAILAAVARLEADGVSAPAEQEAEDDSGAQPSNAVGEAPETAEDAPDLDFRSILLDPEWEHAAVVVEHLAGQGSTFATKYLSVALTQGYFALRVAVMQAIAAHSGPEALDLLMCALDNSESGIQEMAATALGQIRDPRALMALMDVAKPAGLFDKRARLRAAAMIALGNLHCTAAFDLLERTLRYKPLFRREAGAELSAAAAAALGRLGTERARGILERGLWDRRRLVRDACQKALSDSANRQN